MRERGGLAVAMAGAAGCVDAVGYLVLAHLFTAHMSGNSVAFGADLGRGVWGEVLRRGFPIPLFVLGVAAGGVAIEAGHRRGLRCTMSLVLLVEAALLGAFVGGAELVARRGVVAPSAGPPYYWLASMLTVAMGLQTAALQRVGGRAVRTTYVTGMLTRFAEESVVFLFWFRDERRARGRRRMREWARSVREHRRVNRAVLLAAIWSGYLAGAVCGGVLDARVHGWAVTPALVVIAAVIVTDQRHPIHGSADVRAAIDA